MMRVVVIGAGAFGGWTAWHLLRRGAQVTLLDAYGPGNSKASSGGETRVIRSIYGNDTVSMRISQRALVLWKEYQERWKTTMYLRSGSLFMGTAHDDFLQTSCRAVRAAGVAVEELSISEAARRFPAIQFDGVESVLFEPDAGVLFARQNCRTVVQNFVAEGGTYQLVQTAPLPALDGSLRSISLTDGRTIEADHFVFACGPWTNKVIPGAIGSMVRASRQEVLFFSTPAGDSRFAAPAMPCWADRTSDVKFYGLPDVEYRGFKMASDLRGDPFDPDSDDRLVAPSVVQKARQYLAQRFPALTDATLTETRVCQYENSPDLALLADRHPAADNVWVLGGGSGHGYKQGPAIGEHVAALLYGETQAEPQLSLARFAGRKADACDFQGSSF